MSYSNKRCDRCNITEKEFYKHHPKNPEWVSLGYNPLNTFYWDGSDGYWCGECHKEIQLEKLFKLMDDRKKTKHQNL
jgi:hypothetical protein